IFTAADVNLASVSATLNDAPFISGTSITVDGDYRLTIQATDAAGNVAVATVAFTIDATPPVITVTGVADGECANHAVFPVVTVTDAHLQSSSPMLDGTPFVPGSAVTLEGAHVLTVT